MAETVITKQVIAMAGVAPSFAAVNADGSRFVCPTNSRLYLHFKNTNGSTRTVTILKQQAAAKVPGYGPVTLSNFAVTVPITTGERLIGPIPPACVDAEGYAHFTVDAHADLTVGLFELAEVA